MTGFARLHPAIQYHVVNSLGWSSLRPLQEQAIDPLLAGEHALLIAPTASGKTEAAILPVLSQMLTEDWRGVSVLYVCPLKALLNDLAHRLGRYCGFIGRRVQLWHGDVSQREKAHVPSEPPDILLTTPESIEVLLTSRDRARREMLRDVRVVIVDELHAFAGDDRGWHLLAVLERVTRVAGREIQRIGLSATIGNPEALIQWLRGSGSRASRVIAPEQLSPAGADIEIDYVGTLANAATVISRLHRGEKRLVFCDSRARVEDLSARLRDLGIATFVSHGSLGVDERRRAEQAFSEARDCVIVSTSTLELGIDVGDLDRVIQIDAPATVAAFQQRLGRTGRREGSRRNLLFLATSDDALLRAAAQIRLWRAGFVEPLAPPPFPVHLCAQQILALVLQEGRITRPDIVAWCGGVLRAAGIAPIDLVAILDHMVANAVLFEDGGLHSMGLAGEASFGMRNFLELFSIFSTPPLFTVVHGRTEIGQVGDASFFVPREGQPIIITLAGRHWKVEHIDWARRVALVVPAEESGKARWLGLGAPVRFEIARSIAAVLGGDEPGCAMTKRATEMLTTLRDEFSWVRPEETTVVLENDRVRWWTFAGVRANTQLAGLREARATATSRDRNLAVDIEEPADADVIVDQLHAVDLTTVPIFLDPRVVDSVKFRECVPPQLIERMLQERWRDPEALRWVANAPRRVVVNNPTSSDHS